MDRRRWAAAVLGGIGLPRAVHSSGGSVPDDDASKARLRVPFEAAETGFDPVRVSDAYSRRVLAHIFEALYHYDYLATPVRLRPLTAAALPEVSADYRVWTVRMRAGVFFTDDPAFGGVPRELTAADYVYTLKRFFDPALRSPSYSWLAEEGIEGLADLRETALRDQRPFDYDAPVHGLRALDRHTLQIRLTTARPRFVNKLANSSQVGAVAREVVEAYGDEITAHPVGTGPYRLALWRRSSRIVLERNRGFRPMYYDVSPEADDVEGQAWLARFSGRRLPLNDGIDIAVIEEEQARWLSFLNGEIDYLRTPITYGALAMPNGRLAPYLARRGVRGRRYVNADFTMSYFNMEDRVVGGYAPVQVALRRAIGLAYDIEREIRLLRHGEAILGQAPMTPGSYGYDPVYRSINSRHDPASASALLDIYGYRDANGDGWRERPDGSPLVLRIGCQNDSVERQFNELWQKSLQAVGIRVEFRPAQWPENLKAARAGALQMWRLADSATDPDAQPSLEYMYGPSAGSTNLARFRLPAFDAIYRRMQVLPDGPERLRLFREAANLVAAYMPYRIHAHRISSDLSQPWITGWRQPPFSNEQWHYVEVDPEREAARAVRQSPMRRL